MGLHTEISLLIKDIFDRIPNKSSNYLFFSNPNAQHSTMLSHVANLKMIKSQLFEYLDTGKKKTNSQGTCMHEDRPLDVTEPKIPQK